MNHSAAFHQGFSLFVKVKKIVRLYTIFLKELYSGNLGIYNGLSHVFVSTKKEESIQLQRY